jgi:hypothetical protein
MGHLMKVSDDREHPNLVRAILNSNLAEIARWTSTYGLDHRIILDTSDLLGTSSLQGATVLNVALHLRNEQVAAWALNAGASLNIATWSSDSPFHPADQSEQDCHPLLVALQGEMPRAVKLIADRRCDLFFRGHLPDGSGNVCDTSLWSVIKNDPFLVGFCLKHNLNELLTQIEDCAAATARPRRLLRRCV